MPPHDDPASPGGLLDGLPEAGRGTGNAPPPTPGGARPPRHAAPESGHGGHRAAPPQPPAAQSAPAEPARPEAQAVPADPPQERTAPARPAPPDDSGPTAERTARNVIPLRAAAAERSGQRSPEEQPPAPPRRPPDETSRSAAPPAPHDRRTTQPESRNAPVNAPSAAPEPEPRPVEEAEASETEPVDPATAPADDEPVDYGAEVVAEPAGLSAEPDAVHDASGGPAGEPVGHGYSDVEREAVHRVIRERRDVRVGFRPDPVPDDVLVRVLEAAHHAPSVGFSQPWDFVVIHDRGTRARVRDVVQRQREAYARALPGARARAFSGLKVEAILDTPLNIVVTVDPTRGGRHTLGRHAQPQTAAYSTALAVENLWLAARAEGLGVGWVSFFSERELARELDLPPHLEIIAYLCVGYVEEFPPEPELSLGGWAQRRPLAWAVHHEQYGQRGLPGQESTSLLEETVAGTGPLNQRAVEEARERQSRMTKPPGSLGVLEDVSVQLAGLAGECPPPVPEPAAVAVFAADHGVHAQGVTAWPQEVTTQMVHNFLNGGAVVNAFAAQVGAEVTVVDVGVVDDLPAVPGLLPRKIARGTADMTRGPAMSRLQAEYAIEAGIEVARDLVAAGNRCLLTGDMGIANTTASAALVAAFTGRDAAEVTGRGTGVDDAVHEHKIEVVRTALHVNRVDPDDPVGTLAAVGGLEHAALAGFVLGAASLRVPVLLDGVIAGAAALAAVALAPEARSACVAGHRSSEPGHSVALEHLGLRPLVDLELRLGEGSGALLALPLVQSAVRALRDVATFDSAGVTRRD
ncbi:nicotinate-nucleotide--dimethylbenzimidazole phosphoribosyltransferase [Thermobifida halotolerans]|uniref:Nicotinate-nucleotide--dimethylbenzimidazole phosphoribosyltransferase n=1 Tax=Thermobifida halotolerans TaxID=483545 RepID=A0AA97M2C9_9ACTN|nr:nicotinate-nucleotide--dimethylbenzimidazole phosphoribosyltransferase [Thermobifida halotolerans]UOE22050.1 nicotinate-nucleotide--dimethylbenzimidazole phosphoribosyltransferase [Thermobifida halotolerans]